MRIEDERESDNVEDMRGAAAAAASASAAGGLSVGGVVLALVASYIFGVDPRMLLGMMEGAPAAGAGLQRPRAARAAPTRKAVFVSRVLATTEDTWSAIFSEARQALPAAEARAVHAARSRPACGMGQAAAGPFYCPGDAQGLHRPALLRAHAQRFHAAGDFAQAYVIAHEVGHHVQNLLGITRRWTSSAAASREQAYNALSVRLELQADCFAGVWANRDQPRQALPRARRRRGGDTRGDRDRRRHAAKAGAGPRRAGFVHARHLGAARALAAAGARDRRRERVRHVQGPPAVDSTACDSNRHRVVASVVSGL